MVVRTQVDEHGTPMWRHCWVWCPGCKSMHPFRVPLPDGTNLSGREVWDWDGNMKSPTFSPSLLCRGSVHRCSDEHLIPCPGGDCGHTGHRVLADGSLATHGPHTADPPRGDCHSFLRAGRWEFLADSAHPLAGQTVPMEPVPDWWLHGTFRVG